MLSWACLARAPPPARSVSASRRQPSHAGTHRISSLALFGVVALAPLPFGSTDPEIVAAWCVVLGAALIAASPRALDARQLALLGLPAAIVAGYGVVLHEQLSAHPWFAEPHPLWRQAGDALGAALAPSVSIMRNQPLFAIGPPLAALLILVLSFIVCVDRRRARALLQVVAWSGSAYAVLGIAFYLFEPDRLLWREKEAYLGSLTGTFINRNTAAVYFGACAAVALLLLLERLRRLEPADAVDWRAMSAMLLADLPRPLLAPFAMFLLCLVAMFVTGSRAGVVLSLMALVTAFTLFLRRHLSRRSSIVTVLMIAPAVALLLLQVVGTAVGRRFDEQALSDGGRLETYRATFRMIADHPWFGTGLGTFAWGYPAYRSDHISMWGVWDRAHDTLLELTAEAGLPLAALVAGAWAVALALLLRGVLVRRRDLIVPVAALVVSALAALHSLVDFSLQIPGFAIVTFALMGAGLAQSVRPSGQPSERARQSGSGDAGATSAEV